MSLVQVSARHDWVFVSLPANPSLGPHPPDEHSPGRCSAPASQVLGQRLCGLLLSKQYDAIESIPYPIYESEIVVTSNRSRSQHIAKVRILEIRHIQEPFLHFDLCHDSYLRIGYF
jgi:hypothetical protein